LSSDGHTWLVSWVPHLVHVRTISISHLLVLDTTRNRLNRKSDLPLGQIGVARDAYNGVVREYNTAITTFPAVLMARSMGFTPRGFFEAQAESREVPSVQLR
jgi:hypothetical protein